MAISSKMKKLLDKRQKNLASKGGGKIPFFLVKEGVTRARLLPVPPDTEFAIEASFFFLSKELGSLISPATFGEPCGMMEAYQRLKGSKDEDDREMAKKIQPKKRYFAVCYKFQDEKGQKVDHESGVKLIILTNGQYQDLIDLYLDEDEAGDMTDPKTGYDIKFKRTGSGQFDTEYSLLKCKSTPIDPKYRKLIADPEEELRKLIPTYEETCDLAKQVVGVSKKSGDKSLKKKKKLLKKKIRS